MTKAKKDTLVLTTLIMLIMSLSAWAGITLVDHGKEIVRIDIREKSNKELLVEIRKDIKVMLVQHGAE